ncbi:hypothetical protein CPB86DRAFT_780781 [Serendipita vermifera]|nr:hypothetical protein CPB86DRAFT_780781 [Serendipita vermifera]
MRELGKGLLDAILGSLFYRQTLHFVLPTKKPVHPDSSRTYLPSPSKIAVVEYTK